jgi:hypothetical protein
MTDFQAWNMTTHPIVRLENDYNNILHHGLEKPATYIIRKNGSYYEAIQGTTSSNAGTIAYGGVDNAGSTSGTDGAAVINAALAACTAGGLLWFAEGQYTIDTTLTIPNAAKSITLAGVGRGKTADSGYGSELVSTIAADHMLTINATSDVRSAFGIKFCDLKFIGPDTAGSIGLELLNIDTFEMRGCLVSQFDDAVKVSYSGAGYPVAEQPGMGWIHHSVFSTGKDGGSCFLTLEKCTEMFIDHCVFGWGEFQRCINVTDSNKTHINHCEFQDPTTTSNLDQHIYIDSVAGGDFVPQGILLTNNWAYIKANTGRFITTNGTGITRVVSRGNLLDIGYTPTIDSDALYTASEYDDLVAQDYASWPNSPANNLRTLGPTYPVGTAYQNNFTPLTLYIYVKCVDATDYVDIQLSKQLDGSSLQSIGRFATNSADDHVTMMTLHVPTLWWWKVVVNNNATQEGLYGVYQ